MSDYSGSTRRRLLQASGGLAVFGLAGCLGDSGEQQQQTTATQTETATATQTEGGDATDAHTDGHHGNVPEGPSSSAEVKMLTQDGSYHFSPHVAWVEKGGTVTFALESGGHSATAYAPANDKPRRIPEGATAFDSGVLSESGATYEVTLETAGVYDYFCIPHESLGMLGSIIVGRPDPETQPGLSEPQQSLPEDAQKKIHSLNETVRSALSESGNGSETTEPGTHTHGTETHHSH